MSREVLLRYRDWLLNDYLHFNWDNYTQLMTFLIDSTFEYSLDMDENRALDGLYLREICPFVDENDLIEYDCSVLEMMCALAYRIETEYIGDPMNIHPEIVFAEMLCNLNLIKFHDRNFRIGPCEDILDVWLERKFEPNGKGSLFVVRNAVGKDFRKVEIWSQMLAYISSR